MSGPTRFAGDASASSHSSSASPSSTLALMLGAIGVVYGDIGTSPLYALKECFSPASPHHIAATPQNVLGALSLVFWSLVVVIVVKYLTFVMRADNHGAGGILALLALLPPRLRSGRSLVLLLALFGTALLYGDGVITPAISVLSAVEGLGVATSAFEPMVVPITLVVLAALFSAQRLGTASVGRLFGPVTLLWFVVIAALGAAQLARGPDVIAAVDPRFAARFLSTNGAPGFLVLGSIFLVVTGGEALYADMGHFGRGVIQRAWYLVVFPALILSYFGQASALLADPGAASNPFFSLVPGWALYPVVAIATCATVVASQALISGAFSLTQQAVQLGFFPRVTIVHTSRDAEGQIYIPEINALLFVGTAVCVLLFKSSSALAAAYGIAVTGTMSITTVLYYFVATKTWGRGRLRAGALAAGFLVFDVAFLGANAAKFAHGGWLPLAIGITVFSTMLIWYRGRQQLWEAIRPTLVPLDAFLQEVSETKPARVPSTAIFMASSPTGTPPALTQNFKHNRVLHERVLLLSVQNLAAPEAADSERVSVEPLGEGFSRVTLR